MNNENQQKCLKYFLNILGKGDYSIQQLIQKGKLRQIDQTDIDFAIGWLVKYNYVNDERLAQNLTDFYSGQKGVQWLKMKLIQKGIPTEIIKKVTTELESMPSLEVKNNLAIKLKIDNWQNLDLKQKNKIIYFLSSRGFPNPFAILQSWQSCQ